MIFEHRPRRAYGPPAIDDATIDAAAAGCPNCHAPTHPEARVGVRYRLLTTVCCVACSAADVLRAPSG
jgi:hypothetical protein